jgi:peptide/nickel transport system permease protein
MTTAAPRTIPAAVAAATALRQSGRSAWTRFLRNRRALVGAIVVGTLLLVAAAAPLVATHPPATQSLLDRLEAPGRAHLMGTDSYGRDVWSRTVWAGQISLLVGFVSTVVAIAIGLMLGLASGYYGGPIDNVLMRFTDAVIAFPTFFLLVTAVAVFGNRLDMLILLIGATSWPVTARLVRGEVLSLKTRDFVAAARALGARDARIMFAHLLPNLVSVLVVVATIRMALAILLEAGLSFLGLGVQPPTASWGNMVADGYEVLRRAWWVSTFPGAFIFAVVLGLNLIGDGLRDAFDPRMNA